MRSCVRAFVVAALFGAAAVPTPVAAQRTVGRAARRPLTAQRTVGDATTPAATAPRIVARLRSIRLDSAGARRWGDDGSEVALFGANSTLSSASDFRAAGYLHLDRKRLVDEDMAQFARMGWDALRISFWGDFENSDSAAPFAPLATFAVDAASRP